MKKVFFTSKEKSYFTYCLLITFLLGLISHAYAYFHSSFSHDSLRRIYADTFDTSQKISLGRFLTPAYRAIAHGNIALPWLIGLFALLWISLSVYLVAKMFCVESRFMIFLLSGIMATNLTVTAMTATYIFELDADMFALLTATMAAYLWHRYSRGFLPGMIFVTITLGLYQSYLSVVITLIILLSLMALLQGDTFHQVFLNGIKGIVMIGGGGILYIIFMRLTCLAANVTSSDGYNGLSNISKLSIHSIPRLICGAYRDWFLSFLQPHAAYIGAPLRIANAVLLCITVIIVIIAVTKAGMPLAAKALFLLLMALLPIGMNISFILSNGMVHDLMRYAFWFSYLPALLFINWLSPTVSSGHTVVMATRCVVFITVLIILWNNIQASNAVYLKKDLESEAAISQMTRVLSRLEETPGYVSGVSPVVFVGSSSLSVNMSGFETLTEITGVWAPTVGTIFDFGRYQSYFTYILNTPIALDEETWSAFQTDYRVAEMPAFPAAGCIQQLDGVFIVKMGD